jgi:hypothetical protein
MTVLGVVWVLLNVKLAGVLMVVVALLQLIVVHEDPGVGAAVVPPSIEVDT